MNSRKILWKWIQILLCITPLFGPSWAEMATYNKTKFQLFSKNSDAFEHQLIKSLETTQNFFATKELANLALFGLAATAYAPTLAPIAGLAFVIRAFLASESDWKESFAKTIAHQTRIEIAASEIRLQGAAFKTIESKYRLMVYENQTNSQHRNHLASYLHSEVDKLLNFFGSGNSLYKRYPGLISQLLIALAQIVAFIDPVAKNLIPKEAKSPELSCKMHNILQDILPRTVHARLEKLHVDAHEDDNTRKYFPIVLKAILDVMSVKYRPNGYNTTMDDTMNCEINCKKKNFSKETLNGGRNYFYTKKNAKCFPICNACVVDDYGTDSYYFPPNDCLYEYGLLIRHRIEKLFPIDLLNKLCAEPPPTTGYGWITIHIKAVAALFTGVDQQCDLWLRDPCDPFIKLYIDGELQLQTPVQQDTSFVDDVDVVHTSKRITKRTKIKIEVWDKDYNYFWRSNPDLIIRAEGDVDSFLKNGHIVKGIPGYSRGPKNYISTISFWQDEYKYNKDQIYGSDEFFQ